MQNTRATGGCVHRTYIVCRMPLVNLWPTIHYYSYIRASGGQYIYDRPVVRTHHI